MGISDISGIGKVLVQAQTKGVNGGTQEEELQVAFHEVMSQMQASVGEGLMSGRQAVSGDTGLTSGRQTASSDADYSSVESAENTDYSQYGTSSVRISESSDANEMEQEQVTEKLDEFAENVKEVLKEKLGVSEEQIEEAMEALGLQYSDLLLPKQLAALVGELTGTQEIGALLCSEEFMDIMQSVGELGENLLQQLGINGEELTQMISEMPKLDVSEQLPEDDTVQEMTVSEVPEPDVNAQVVTSVRKDIATVDGLETDTDEPTFNDQNSDKLVVNEKLTTDEQETDSAGQQMLESSEEPTEDTAGDTHKSKILPEQQTAENPGTQTRNDITGTVNQNVAETAYAQAGEVVNGTASQVNVEDIIKQIVEFSRVTLNNSTTTMEMQLTPENLGKIYMSVTSKAGVVSAHIVAQNEAVKEVLESQLTELRQNMNQAGIKVEAVEVTVESHEFEKNLEQNANQEQQQKEAQEKAAKQTRHINLNDLSELSGVMTEEENLVAQMMADQGNSIDFTA